MSAAMVGLVQKVRLARRRQRIQFVAAAARAIMREQVRNRNVVMQTLAQHGLNVESVSDGYREVYCKLARVEIVVFRLVLMFFVMMLIGLIAFWRVIGDYFGEPPGLGVSSLSGAIGFITISAPIFLIAVLGPLLPALNRTLLFVFVVLLAMTGLIVYGEIIGEGPVHALVGNLDSENKSMYPIAMGILSYGFMFVLALLVALVAVFVRGRAYPRERALRILFISIALSALDDTFMRADTRRRLAALMLDLALIARVGLWKVVRPPSVLARSVLRDRCVQAAQSIEMMCVWVALPAKTTRMDFVYKMCCLVDTLLSGRFDELPTEPARSAVRFQGRIAPMLQFGRTILIGAIPLGVLGILAHFRIVPPDPVIGALKGVFWVWFSAAMLAALGELHTGRVLFREFRDLLTHVGGGK